MKFLFAAFLLLASAAVSAQTLEPALTLEDVISLAVKNSVAVLSSEQSRIVAEKQVTQARATRFPQISISANGGESNLDHSIITGEKLGYAFLEKGDEKSFYSIRAQAMLPIYTGGRTGSAVKLAKNNLRQTRVNYDAEKENAKYRAKLAFYSLLFAQTTKEQTEKQAARAAGIRASLKLKDYEEIEASVLCDSLRNELSSAETRYREAYSDFLSVISREASIGAQVSGSLEVRPISGTVSDSIITAMEYRSELKNEIYQAERDEIDVKLAMLRNYPSIYVGGLYDINTEKFNDLFSSDNRYSNWAVMVSITMPLSYTTLSEVQASKAMQRQGNLKRVELREEIRKDITNDYNQTVAWQDKYEKLSEQYGAVKEKYDALYASLGPSLTALRTYSVLCGLERQMTEAAYGQLTSRARLEWSRGADFSE